MSVVPIESVGALNATPILPGAEAAQAARRSSVVTSFSQMLLDGVHSVDQKLVNADAMAKAFAVDDSVPLHQVTFAMEQARLSFELALQVRSRLVEGYQDLMRMQL